MAGSVLNPAGAEADESVLLRFGSCVWGVQYLGTLSAPDYRNTWVVLAHLDRLSQGYFSPGYLLGLRWFPNVYYCSFGFLM